MATKTSLIINSVTQSGIKNQKTLTDVNADVSSTVLKEFAEKLNALTTNTYGSTTRVDKGALADANTLTPTTFSVKETSYNEDEDETYYYAYPTSDPFKFVLKISKAVNKCVFVDSSYEFATNTDAVPRVLSTPTYGALAFYTKSSSASDYADAAHTHYYHYEVWGTDAAGEVGTGQSNDAKAGMLGDYVFYFPQTETYAPATLTFTVVDE